MAPVPLVAISAVTWIVSAVTVRLPVLPGVASPSERFEFKLMVSKPVSPLMTIAATKPLPLPLMLTVSSPVPALMVRDVVGWANVTDSLAVELIVDWPGVPESVTVIVSAPPRNVNRRLREVMVSRIGSRPV